jgi:hypothetical protein
VQASSSASFVNSGELKFEIAGIWLDIGIRCDGIWMVWNMVFQGSTLDWNLVLLEFG